MLGMKGHSTSKHHYHSRQPLLGPHFFIIFENAKIRIFLHSAKKKQNRAPEGRGSSFVKVVLYILSDMYYFFFLLASLASTVIVAWGTIIRRSLGMSLPVA